MNEIFYNGTNTMYNQANFENIQIFIFYTLLYVLIPENYEFTICSNTSDVHVHKYMYWTNHRGDSHFIKECHVTNKIKLKNNRGKHGIVYL